MSLFVESCPFRFASCRSGRAEEVCFLFWRRWSEPVRWVSGQEASVLLRSRPGRQMALMYAGWVGRRSVRVRETSIPSLGAPSSPGLDPLLPAPQTDSTWPRSQRIPGTQFRAPGSIHHLLSSLHPVRLGQRSKGWDSPAGERPSQRSNPRAHASFFGGEELEVWRLGMSVMRLITSVSVNPIARGGDPPNVNLLGFSWVVCKKGSHGQISWGTAGLE